MSDDIIINTQLCNPDSATVNPNGCNEVNLKISKAELIKVHASIISEVKPVPDIDYSISAQFWGLAFTTTFFLWLFAKGIGEILKLIKNA